MSADDRFWLRRYWSAPFADNQGRRWCLACAEWFVGRADCPLCHGVLVVEAPEPRSGQLVGGD